MTALEVCVDTLEGAKAAIAGGAERIELCSSLSEGGLTPSNGLMQAAAQLSKPCFAMIRPRSGLFHFNDDDMEIMLKDIATARTAGLAGVVLGIQNEAAALDIARLRILLEAAGPLGTTLHRVIDVVPDPVLALKQAIDLGFNRVLTSGAEPFAPEGAALIAQMVHAAGDQISVMPGCGLTPENVQSVVQATGVSEVHAACSVKAAGDPAFSDFDPPAGRYVTSITEVRRFVDALMN